MSLVSNPGHKTKTPSAKTFGVLLFGAFGLWSALTANAGCAPTGAGELATVDRVYDGDTLRLTDGRHVRVLGVNAPEVDHGKKKNGQALGNESRAAAEAFFKNNKTVRLFYDVQRVDRYERTLAHIYDLKGNNLSSYLLRKGLAFHIAVPPNLSFVNCLHADENIARQQKLGVWQSADWQATPAAQLTMSDTGFKRVRGRVVSVRQEKSIWLELDGPLVIKISPSDKKNFSVQQWHSWKGKQIEVRGWVTARSNGTNKRSGDAMSDEPEGKDGDVSKATKKYKSLVIQPRIGEALELL